MIRRLLRLALLLLVLVLVAAASLVWLLYAPKPAVPRLHGVLRSSSLEVGGRVRTFDFYVPARLRPNPPLLLVLHGSMMDGARVRAATGYGFDEIADREGFIVAYPDGYAGHWNECRAIGDFEAKRLGIDDVAFLRTLTGWFAREHGVSKSEVYAIGISNGGQMSYRLALEAPDLVRAVAAIAASLPAPGNQRCVPTGRPVPAMIVNGTADPINPFEGGEVSLFGLLVRRGKVQSTLDSARYWARLSGADGPPVEEPLPDTDPSDGTRAKRLTWPGARVEVLAIEGGGHTIPHPKLRTSRILGRTCRDFSAAEAIWEFFDGTKAPWAERPRAKLDSSISSIARYPVSTRSRPFDFAR